MLIVSLSQLKWFADYVTLGGATNEKEAGDMKTAQADLTTGPLGKQIFRFSIL